MSSNYEMHFSIKFEPDSSDEFKEGAFGVLKEVLDQECEIYGEVDFLYQITTQVHLSGGDEAFSRRMCEAFWQALGCYVEVQVQSIYLDELPYETFSFTELDYEESLIQMEETSDVQRTGKSTPAGKGV